MTVQASALLDAIERVFANVELQQPDIAVASQLTIVRGSIDDAQRDEACVLWVVPLSNQRLTTSTTNVWRRLGYQLGIRFAKDRTSVAHMLDNTWQFDEAILAMVARVLALWEIEDLDTSHTSDIKHAQHVDGAQFQYADAVTAVWTGSIDYRCTG